MRLGIKWSRSCLPSNVHALYMLAITLNSHTLVPAQVYKVLFAYTPHKEDELELLEGDYISVSASDQGRTGKMLHQ